MKLYWKWGQIKKEYKDLEPEKDTWCCSGVLLFDVCVT